MSRIDEEIKQRIQMILVNTNEIKDIDCVSYKFNDLSVVFNLNNNNERIKEDFRTQIPTSFYNNFLLVDEKLQRQLGLDMRSLVSLAFKNTKRLSPQCIQLLHEAAKEEYDANSPSSYMYILTNQLYNYGAVNMLFKQTLYGLASSIDDDLYILPSSVHEVILLPSKFEPLFGNIINSSIQEYVETCNANSGVMGTPDFLSNTVYYYDLINDEIRLAD